jgi:hypothetical protein
VLAYRGRIRLALIRDLAMGEWSHKELAVQMGTSAADITVFAHNFSDEISEVRAALAGRLAIETSGAWIAKKQDRLAEMQALYEDNDLVIAGMRSPDARPGNDLGSKRHFNLARLQLSILRAAAEEVESRAFILTQPRTDDEPTTTYVIEAGAHHDNLT